MQVSVHNLALTPLAAINPRPGDCSAGFIQNVEFRIRVSSEYLAVFVPSHFLAPPLGSGYPLTGQLRPPGPGIGRKYPAAPLPSLTCRTESGYKGAAVSNPIGLLTREIAYHSPLHGPAKVFVNRALNFSGLLDGKPTVSDCPLKYVVCLYFLFSASSLGFGPFTPTGTSSIPNTLRPNQWKHSASLRKYLMVVSSLSGH